jgi:hypothetical protein
MSFKPIYKLRDWIDKEKIEFFVFFIKQIQ